MAQRKNKQPKAKKPSFLLSIDQDEMQRVKDNRIVRLRLLCEDRLSTFYIILERQQKKGKGIVESEGNDSMEAIMALPWREIEPAIEQSIRIIFKSGRQRAVFGLAGFAGSSLFTEYEPLEESIQKCCEQN